LIDEPDEWAGAIGLLRNEGFSIISGMMSMRGEDYSTLRSIARTGGVRPDETWSDNLHHARAVAELAGREGIGLVTFHAGFIPEPNRDPQRRKIITRLQTIADIFRAEDVRLALETGQETAETLLEALNELDRPEVGVNFDPANMILYGMGDPIEAIDRLHDHVRQIHVKDAVPTQTPGEWGREVPAGEGAVDWEALFEVAGSISPPVTCVIEREGGAQRIEEIIAARNLVMNVGGMTGGAW
jgi:sugar phosphate isomerase/epimerase